MTEELLLGLDVGTTFCKAGVITLDGSERGHGRARTPWRPVPTGAEMDARDLLSAALAAAREALDAAPAGRVVGVGITSMAETGALLDGHGDPIAPMIAWHDRRGDEESGEIAAAFGSERFTERTGLPVSRLCSLAKYRWIRGHIPESKRGARWLSVAEWIIRGLGGDEIAELSLASRTGFLDLGRRTWWEEALEWAEAPTRFLPEPTDAGTPVGRVRGGLPEAKGAVLAAAGHDHSCASVGAGATRPGDVFDSCGTAEAFVRVLERLASREDIRRAVAGGVTVGWHTLPGQQGLLAGFISGLALQRFLDLLGVDRTSQEALDAAAAAIPPGAAGMKVRNVTGDRADVQGIPRSVGPPQVWRAALEAVARHGAEALAMIEAVAGPTHRLVVTGGWARNPALRAVKREVLGPFDEPLVQEAGCRGAALIAGIAAGVYGGVGDLPSLPVASRAD